MQKERCLINFPETWTKLRKKFTKIYSNFEIGYKVIKQFIGDSINKNDLKEILSKTIDFNFPVVKLEKNIYILYSHIMKGVSVLLFFAINLDFHCH